MILALWRGRTMPDRTMNETLDALGQAFMEELDEIVRVGHTRFSADADIGVPAKPSVRRGSSE